MNGTPGHRAAALRVRTRLVHRRVLFPLIVALWAVPAGAAPSAAASQAVPGTVPGPGGSTIAGRCTQYEPVLAAHAPPSGWDVALMSQVMWRESTCTPAARSSTADTGLLQINDVNLAYLRVALGEWVSRWSLTDPVQNIRAAAALCSYWQGRGRSCYDPWKLPAAQPLAGRPAPAAAAPNAATTTTTTTAATTVTTAVASRRASDDRRRCPNFDDELRAWAPPQGRTSRRCRP